MNDDILNIVLNYLPTVYNCWIFENHSQKVENIIKTKKNYYWKITKQSQPYIKFLKGLISIEIANQLEIDSEILNFLRECKKLKKLKYYHSRFDFNKLLPFLIQLEILICANCHIVELPNTLVNLKILRCNFNLNLKNIPKEYSNLTILDCEECHITELPNTLTKLKILKCGNNDIKNIPKEYSKLKYLDLNYDCLSSCGNITELPDTLTELQTLNCETTRLSSIPSTCTNLEFLNCGQTLIKKIPPTLIKLKSLDCYDSAMEESPEISELTTLYCQNTKIKSLSPKLINLISLNCSDIKNIYDLPKEYHKLEKLDCSWTNISCIPKEYCQLEELICNCCLKLEEIPDTLVNLENLNFWNCPIKLIPKTLTKLKVLDCSHSLVEEIPNELIKLQKLDCHKTKIKIIIHSFNLDEISVDQSFDISFLKNKLEKFYVYGDNCPCSQ
jgi:Leucine-rich repeat (LRR) protein